MIQDQHFGIEIEMTGITRKQAADVLAAYFGTSSEYIGGAYEKYRVRDTEGRFWTLMNDSSIDTYRKVGKDLIPAHADYAVELVSPICEYRDIKTIQEMIRQLRDAGAVANDSTGIHIHIDASKFDTNSLRNLTNIMRSKEDLLYKALQVRQGRENDYCRKVDETFLQEVNLKKPKTREELKMIWYEGSDGSGIHYHGTRYRGLNLHSVFQKGTIEFRLFNGTTHAGKVKTYIQLSLAITNQALTQRKASYTRTHSANEKYTFRTWLLRLGLIGEEFKTARLFLLKHLEGNIAWKDPTQIEKQKERLSQKRQETEPAVYLERQESETAQTEEDMEEQTEEIETKSYGYGGLVL